MQEVLHSCMTGQMTDAQIASFLALMRMKGETEAELTAAAQVMRQYAHTLELEHDPIDIVGTGGDGRNTFNVSTASSFVIAAAGTVVAKHGNRSVSSRSGSADVLETAGIALNLEDDQIRECLKQCNLAFLFAPHYHPALVHARSARQQLGIRTFFNLLGPLLNPACVKKQVVGVFSKIWLKPVAQVLKNLGSQRALVVHSHDGLDELSVAAPTDMVELKNNTLSTWEINPKDYNLSHASLDELSVDSPEQSLEMILSVFSGTKGSARDMVVLNSAAALYCANDHTSFEEGIHLAQQAIDSGKAKQCYDSLLKLTTSFTADKTL